MSLLRAWLCVVVIVCGVFGNLAFQAGAAVRYLDPWIGTQADRAERLDQNRTIASAWVVSGCSLLLCGVIVRRRGVAAGFGLSGLFVSALAIGAWNQADDQLTELVAPHTRWLSEANETMDSLGLPAGYEASSTHDSPIGAADEVDRWSVDRSVSGANEAVDSELWAGFLDRVAGPIRECRETNWTREDAFELPGERRLVVSSSGDERDVTMLSVVRSEATDTWETSCGE